MVLVSFVAVAGLLLRPNQGRRRGLVADRSEKVFSREALGAAGAKAPARYENSATQQNRGKMFHCFAIR
jgi:hypothetical protein